MSLAKPDTIANRLDTLMSKTPLMSLDMRLARTCVSKILHDAYTDEVINGDCDIETFRSTVADIINLNSRSAVIDYAEIESQRVLPDKRQPSLREAFNATLDRMQTLSRIEEVFGDSADAVAYGGSMKYGPFMNVRSGKDASDIDLLIFTDGSSHDLLWRGVMESDNIMESDKLTFFARQALYSEMARQHQADIMSQRFRITGEYGGYTLSTHVISKRAMKRMFPTDGPLWDGHAYVDDYKERTFERGECSNFDSSRRRYQVPVYNRAVEGGFVASIPAYSVIGRRYVPGLYQNLVLPTAIFAYDKTGITTGNLQSFNAEVETYMQDERLRHDHNASLENTEPRKPISPVAIPEGYV